MAKGDQPKAQNMINQQGPLAQNYLSSQQGQVGRTTNNLSNTYFGGGGGGMAPSWDQAKFQQMFGTPNTVQELLALEPKLNQQGIRLAANGAGQKGNKIILPSGEYVDIMNSAGAGGKGFQWLANDPKFHPELAGQGGVMGQNLADYGNIMGRYQQFADTGGYSKEDLANIRARAISPTRSIYARGQQELQRNRTLQGGYSPNYAAASAKMARDQSQQISDINRNTEADIAQMVHAGKLAGMGGMAGIYGATPGLSDMFGRQVLASQGQGLEASGLQNQLGLGLIGAQQANAKIPGNWMQGVNNVAGGFDTAGRIGSAIYPWLE